MAFGFPAYHIEHYQPRQPHTLQNTLQKAINMMGWEVVGGNQEFIYIKSSITLWSWGEKIQIRYLPNQNIEIKSECTLPTQCFDWGKNQKNVQQFLSKLAFIEQQEAMGLS